MVIQYFCIGLFFVLLSGLNGCVSMSADSLIRPMLANLQRQTDIDLVCDGTPTFLLMLDSMVASDPENKKLLITATQAFSGYAAALDACSKPERAATVSIKARLYGQSLLWNPDALKKASTQPLSELQQTLNGVEKKDVGPLFWAANGWATWIRYQEGSPASLAQLVRVEHAILNRP
jgi:hypothetical protein